MNNIGGMWLFMEIHLGLLLHLAWPGGGKTVLTSQGLYMRHAMTHGPTKYFPKPL